MLGLALALIAVGVVFFFIFPWVGIPAAILGIFLALVYLVGARRRAAERA